MHTRPPLPIRSRVLTSSFFALCLGAGASAADFTYVGTAGAGSPTWNASDAWTPAGVPTAGNNYIVSNLHVLRTTAGASSTFGGGSLSISGQLNLQGNNGNTHTANITMSSGAVVANARSLTNQSVAGTMQIGDGSVFFKSTGLAQGSGDATNSGKRDITFSTLISGGTGATAHFLRNGDFTLTNANNSFAGTWKAGGSASLQVDGTVVTVGNSSGVASTIKAANAGSLGLNANVALNTWSRFDADFDWTTTGSLTLASNGGSASSIIVTLDQNLTVGMLSIAGTQLAAGEYTYANLVTAGFGDYFTDGGGSITVASIPEPATYASLLGLASLALATGVFRRRS